MILNLAHISSISITSCKLFKNKLTYFVGCKKFFRDIQLKFPIPSRNKKYLTSNLPRLLLKTLDWFFYFTDVQEFF